MKNKKTFLKRALSLFLVAVMTIGVAPLSGFAGLELPGITDLFSLKAEAASYSGTCGTNLTWTLDTDTGVLIISGTGKMADYSYDPPWESNVLSIKSVAIGNGAGIPNLHPLEDNGVL